VNFVNRGRILDVGQGPTLLPQDTSSQAKKVEASLIAPATPFKKLTSSGGQKKQQTQAGTRAHFFSKPFHSPFLNLLDIVFSTVAAHSKSAMSK